MTAKSCDNASENVYSKRDKTLPQWRSTEDMRKRLNDTRTIMDNTGQSLDDMRTNLDDTSKSLGDMHAILDDMRKSLNDSRNRINDTRKNIDEIRNKPWHNANKTLSCL